MALSNTYTFGLVPKLLMSMFCYKYSYHYVYFKRFTVSIFASRRDLVLRNLWFKIYIVILCVTTRLGNNNKCFVNSENETKKEDMFLNLFKQLNAIKQ